MVDDTVDKIQDLAKRIPDAKRYKWKINLTKSTIRSNHSEMVEPHYIHVYIACEKNYSVISIYLIVELLLILWVSITVKLLFNSYFGNYF